jgi:predicted nuclease with TOPRIM domain
MEDGYEQGRESMRAELEAAQAEVERVTRVFGEANVELNEKYDRVGEELDDLRERIGAVLDATEWNDWPGRHRLVRRLLAVVNGRG